MVNSKKKIGYVSIEFVDDDKEDILTLSKQIPKNKIVSATINSKEEGGIVANKLHLTLFYGLDYLKINKKKLILFIKSIRIEALHVVDFDSFGIREFNCKVLFLVVNDYNKELEKLHNEIRLHYPHFKNTNSFKPHIAVAYVSSDFEPKGLQFSFPKSLRVKNIKLKMRDVD